MHAQKQINLLIATTVKLRQILFWYSEYAWKINNEAVPNRLDNKAFKQAQEPDIDLHHLIFSLETLQEVMCDKWSECCDIGPIW